MSVAISAEQGHPLDGTFRLRVPEMIADEVAAELATASLNPNRILEFSLGAETAAYFVSAGSLPALAAIVHSILHRHDGKSFKVNFPDGSGVESTGYVASEEEILSLLEQLAERQRQADDQWRKFTDQPEAD